MLHHLFFNEIPETIWVTINCRFGLNGSVHQKICTMKRSRLFFPDLEARFRKVKLERNKMNYLLGGDDHGGEGGVDDPWNPPD